MLRRHGKHFVASASLSVAAIAYCAVALAASSTLLWQTNLEQAKQLAAQSNRLILVHFWSPSCGPCKQLEKNVFAVPQVQQSIQARFVPVKVNADDWPTTTKQYGITVLPTDLIITPTGQIIGRMVSPPTPDAYLQQLAIASSGAGNMAAPPAAAYAAATQVTPPAAAYAAPPVAGMTAAPPPTTGWAPAAPSVPAMPAVAPGAPSPYAAAPSNAMPVAAPAAAPNVAWGAAPAPANNAPPAVPAYSDSRYAEYYQRFSTASNPAAMPAGNPASVAPPVTAPAAAAMQPAYAPPAYAPPTYSPPAAAPVNYRSTAYGPSAAATAPATAQSAASIPQTNSMPINPPAQPAVTPVAATAPLNNGSPPLALEGYCPVTLLEQQRWQVGDRRWGAVHRGHTYLFAGPEQQKKFLADPDRYSPAVSGQDVVLAMDFGQDVSGKRALGVEYQNRIYLFSSENSRQIFAKNPQRYATEVLQAERATSTTIR